MGVGVDESGDQQAVGGIDPARIVRDRLVRPQHGDDLIPVDQQLGERAVEAPCRQKSSSLDQLLHAVLRVLQAPDS